MNGFAQPGGDTQGGPARLASRPPVRSLPSPDSKPGLRALDLGLADRQALLHVPPGLNEGSPATLVLTLHGAGGNARTGLAPLLPLADANRLLLLAPTAQGSTWDAIRGSWGPDIGRIDRALTEVFASYRVDSSRLVASGFSDGASYALSLGLANGDLFTHVVAFSPGFVVPAPRVGRPAVYVSHGRDDAVLPIKRTTRRIVPWLRESAYPVTVHEFDGAHLVPPAIAEEAVRWVSGGA
ncbi:MAG: phospholipase [Actinomycetota bacterium]|nr:phospholipase [Actinomycetota bacterium]